MTPVEVIVVLGVTSFVVTLAVVPIVRRLALGYGITDNPGGHKHHATPVPYLGGVAIAVCALAASALLPGWTAQAAVGVLAAVIVGATGLVDDVRMLSPVTRLVPEIVAAGIVVWSGDRVTLFGGWVDSALTIVWLVVITNAFNLLDNVDGAAGLIATTIALGMAVSAALQGQWLVGGLAAVLAGSCLGFLRYNWYPARIFMGDAGSLFLGFLLAVIALKLRFPIAHKGSVPAVVLLASPALFDTTMVVLSRIRAHHPIYLGARDHTSHRLLRLGLSTRAVAAVLAAGSACTTALGVAVGRGVVPSAKVVVPIVGVAGLVIMVLLLRVPAGYDELTRPRETSTLERA